MLKASENMVGEVCAPEVDRSGLTEKNFIRLDSCQVKKQMHLRRSGYGDIVCIPELQISRLLILSQFRRAFFSFLQYHEVYFQK